MHLYKAQQKRESIIQILAYILIYTKGLARRIFVQGVTCVCANLIRMFVIGCDAV